MSVWYQQRDAGGYARRDDHIVTPCVSPELAQALARRLQDAVMAGDRLASFALTAGLRAPGPQLRTGEELGAAHDFLLRVLHAVSEPVGWRVLAAVVSEHSRPCNDQPTEPDVPLDILADMLELPRLAVSERVNALIQLGLMSRNLEHDAVTPSPAGAALFDLICELDADIARRLSGSRCR
jgi:hypothetical protein